MKEFSSLFSQSSLVPLAKIANAPSRSLRLLWAAFTVTMFVGLCSCITLVVIQYCRHQTVFQLDYSGRHVIYDQIPGLTLCLQSQDAKRLFLLAVNAELNKSPSPWLNKEQLDKFRQLARQRKPNMTFEVLTHRMPPGQLQWDTERAALSPLYGMLHNFSVSFLMQPSQIEQNHRLTVMEQVPNPKHLLCTTFELRPRHPGVSSWSYLELEIKQPEPVTGSDSYTSFILITHERGELPFSAYDRHIQTSLVPGSEVSVYFSKSVTARLNTARNPCHTSPVVSSLQFGREQMDYDATNSTPSPHVEKSTNQGGSDDEATWHLDFLDRLRMNRAARIEPKATDAALFESSTISLFGTAFLYSREACGWAECSRKVRQVCNCSSLVELWRYKMYGCEQVEECERFECQVKQISYKTCPQACVVAKFVKHNSITETGPETNVAPGTIRVKLVRSEAVQVATEEEIYSLAKLFSEVGGLCSLFIGFSCIFLFELAEAIILMYKNGKSPDSGKANTVSKLTHKSQTGFKISSRESHQHAMETRIVANHDTDRHCDDDDSKFHEPNGKSERLINKPSDLNNWPLTGTDACFADVKEDFRPLARQVGSCKDTETQPPIRQLAWEGETLVIPVCFFTDGQITTQANALTNEDICHGNSKCRLGMTLVGTNDITKADLLSLLRRNRVKLRLC